MAAREEIKAEVFAGMWVVVKGLLNIIRGLQLRTLGRMAVDL